MSKAIHPQCISPCSNVLYSEIAEALLKQKHQIVAVGELITTNRISRMTPETVRLELASLQCRIDRARNALKNKEGR